MKTEKFSGYESPSLETTSAETEKGFCASEALLNGFKDPESVNFDWN